MVENLKKLEEEIKKARESSIEIGEHIKKLEERGEKTHDEPKKIEEHKKKSIKKIPEKTKPKEQIKDDVQEVIKNAVEKGMIKIDTTIREVMTTDVKTAKPEDSLRKILNLLSEYKITGVPVVHKEKVIGIISESDLIKIMDVRNILNAQKDEIRLSELEKIPAHEAMTREVILINEKQKITDAIELMYKHRINRLPVVNDKKNLVGIVTKEDIIKGITSEFFVKSVATDEIRIIETKIDQLIDIVERDGSIPIPNLSKELKVHPEQIERWARILEEHGMVEIEYPPIGPPKLRKKK